MNLFCLFHPFTFVWNFEFCLSFNEFVVRSSPFGPLRFKILIDTADDETTSLNSFIAEIASEKLLLSMILRLSSLKLLTLKCIQLI